MEILLQGTASCLQNPGVESEQLITPAVNPGTHVTITRVHVSPGVCQPRHCHAGSEQIWVALSGQGVLLLSGEEERPFSPGDTARFAPGDIHGLRCTGKEDFVYLSVTAPPLDFSAAYQKKK